MNQEKPLKILVGLLLLFSLLGFIDATYLSAKHFLDSPVECSLLKGCEQVTTSKYATVVGIPVALGGSFYYLAIFLLSIFHTETKNTNILRFTSRLTIIGFLASIWFVYLQVFVIEALCQYCLVSAITSTALFVVGIILMNKLRKKQSL
jgi:uncharacterized membrane protein